MEYEGYPEGISRFNPFFEYEEETEFDSSEDLFDDEDLDDDSPVFEKLIEEHYDE